MTPERRFRDAILHLKSNVAGTRAIILIGPDGLLEHFSVDRDFDIDGFASECAMLLRIARRTSEDTGAGDLTEHISVSEHSMTVARRFGADFYLILVADVQDQIGRARYELRCAAGQLERTMQNRRA